jgi:hypothetical protein
MAETQWQIKVVIRNFYSEILKAKCYLDQCGAHLFFKTILYCLGASWPLVILFINFSNFLIITT